MNMHTFGFFPTSLLVVEPSISRIIERVHIVCGFLVVHSYNISTDRYSNAQLDAHTHTDTLMRTERACVFGYQVQSRGAAQGRIIHPYARINYNSGP